MAFFPVWWWNVWLLVTAWPVLALRIDVKPLGVASQRKEHVGFHDAPASQVSANASVPTVTVVSQRHVNLMLCLPARSAHWLKLLRAAWVDEVASNPNIGIMVFIPNNTDIGDAGGKLDLMRLSQWQGDIGTFQGAFTGALNPCTAHTSANWYAMMDDDVIIAPQDVLRLVSSFDPNRLTLYGRKGELYSAKHFIYGGFMLMNRFTAQKVVANMDDMIGRITTSANVRKLGVYGGTHGFNIDHFFSLAVQFLGGTLVEVAAFGDMRPELPENQGMPSRVVLLHHVKENDLIEFAQSVRKGLAQRDSSSLLNYMRRKCYGICR